MFATLFWQMMQNYTKNEHFIQEWSLLLLFTRNFDF